MWTILHILGALGLFLFGMKVMSEGIQKLSGQRLRALMATVTSSRFSGVASGTLITVLMQSSSATTVMVVSFVNAGILRLREAIAVIMGANLGTTATFWMIFFLGYKFSFSAICLPLIGIALPLLFFKKPRIRDMGETLIGFGILFLGLGELQGSVPDIKNNPEMLEFLQDYTGMGYASFLLFILIGLVLTLTVQSSSAAGAITIAMTVNGWIPLDLSCAIILGENIGTTITANLAAITGNYHSKCAARAHFLFNMIGVTWMLLAFPYFLDFVLWLAPEGLDAREQIAMTLAIFHSLFNFTNILLLVGFVPLLETLSQRLASKQTRLPKDSFTQVHSPLPFTGELNLAATQKELTRLSDLSLEMFDGFTDLLKNPMEDRTEQVKHLKNLEELSDQLSRDITYHLVLCSTDKISIDSATSVSSMLIVAHELEDICDCCYRLTLQVRRKYRKKRDFLVATEQELLRFAELVRSAMEIQHRHLTTTVGGKEMELAIDTEKSINSFHKRIRKESVQRMKDQESVKIEMICITVLNEMEQIADHALNIMQALSRNHPPT